MKSVYPHVLVNPKPKQIAEALAAAGKRANPPRAKARTCCFPDDLAKRIVSHSRKNCEGLFETDGGAVPDSYKYSAETSHLLAAWWTSGNGTRYVRISGGRVGASKHSHGCGNGCAHAKGTPWEVVFPERARQLAAAGSTRVLLAVLRCGVWQHWSADEILEVFAARHSREDRRGKLVSLALRLLPAGPQHVPKRLVASSPRGVVIAAGKEGWLVTRQHDLCLCELFPLPPRFRELNGRTSDELIEAALAAVTGKKLQPKQGKPT